MQSPDPDDRTVNQLSDTVDGFSDLVGAHLALARAELTRDVVRLGSASATLVVVSLAQAGVTLHGVALARASSSALGAAVAYTIAGVARALFVIAGLIATTRPADATNGEAQDA